MRKIAPIIDDGHPGIKTPLRYWMPIKIDQKIVNLNPVSGCFLIEKSDSIGTIEVAEIQNNTKRTGVIEGFQYWLSHMCANKTKKSPEHKSVFGSFQKGNLLVVGNCCLCSCESCDRHAER